MPLWKKVDSDRMIVLSGWSATLSAIHWHRPGVSNPREPHSTGGNASWYVCVGYLFSYSHHPASREVAVERTNLYKWQFGILTDPVCVVRKKNQVARLIAYLDVYTRNPPSRDHCLGELYQSDRVFFFLSSLFSLLSQEYPIAPQDFEDRYPRSTPVNIQRGRWHVRCLASEPSTRSLCAPGRNVWHSPPFRSSPPTVAWYGLRPAVQPR